MPQVIEKLNAQRTNPEKYRVPLSAVFSPIIRILRPQKQMRWNAVISNTLVIRNHPDDDVRNAILGLKQVMTSILNTIITCTWRTFYTNTYTYLPVLCILVTLLNDESIQKQMIMIWCLYVKEGRNYYKLIIQQSHVSKANTLHTKKLDWMVAPYLNC